MVLSKQLPASIVFRHLLRLIARHGRDDLSNLVLWLQNYATTSQP
jgi:hypothetical protein